MTRAELAAFKKDFLASAPPPPRGAPRKDVFHRVLMALRPEAFQECLAAWPRAATPAIDGKTPRRGHDLMQVLVGSTS